MTRGIVIHAALLVIALILGYLNWTRDTSIAPKGDAVPLWSGTQEGFETAVFEAKNRTLRLEARKSDNTQYLWGIETKKSRISKRPKKNTKVSNASPDAGPDAGPPDAAPLAPVEEVKTTTREFPVGKSGQNLVESLSSLKALRDLGKPTDEKLKEYGLNATETSLAVTVQGNTHTLKIGDSIYGGSDRYVLDPNTGRAYALAGQLMQPLHSGESALKLRVLHEFEDDLIKSITIKTPTEQKDLIATTVTDQRGKRTTWAEVKSPNKPDQTMKLLIDQLKRLRPSEYPTGLVETELTPIVQIEYHGDNNAPLGHLHLFKKILPVTPPADAKRPAPKPKAKYYLRTEYTRVLGEVRRASAERIEQDLGQIFTRE